MTRPRRALAAALAVWVIRRGSRRLAPAAAGVSKGRFRSRAMPRILLACLALALVHAPVVAAAEIDLTPTSRYALREAKAELTPASADGRYQVRAELRLSDRAKSSDGRWQLKSTTASCDPFGDPIFSNGFEPAP
jgi:hypothetical protein